MQTVTKTEIEGYPLLARGKVRDIYQVDEDTLLIVTTDRMSAFDVILPDPIPYKGVVLNKLTIHWMEAFRDRVANHLLETDPDQFPAKLRPYEDMLRGRAVIARKTSPLPVECIVRGFISGSGWKDYQASGSVCGIDLPTGLRESDRLPRPLFTPSTKAEAGGHDENISLEESRQTLGNAVFEEIQAASLYLYRRGSALAEQGGIIIADTKFEFGLLQDQPLLIDEVLTPDSSRFWPMDRYQPGQAQPSFDKQYLRDWLRANWDMSTDPPQLPEEVIRTTTEKYIEAYRRLTGKEIE
ncbi:MAG: phosphoribosylaminoimidazolesuccinocarboxamide synthase [Desulfohalobiaceae bacterium]|nr:phosphoribosylaminoimidazolesuccinocarboxamide synthase [Desulfohalobiaceae bacterium]